MAVGMGLQAQRKVWLDAELASSSSSSWGVPSASAMDVVQPACRALANFGYLCDSSVRPAQLGRQRESSPA